MRTTTTTLRNASSRWGQRPRVTLDILDRCLQADEQIDRRVQLVLVLEALTDALGRRLDP